MTRNLKALGLAFCMSLALGALVAQGAGAVELFHSATKSGKTHLTAVQKTGEEGDQVFETTTGEHKALLCSKVSIDQKEGTATFEGATTASITVRPIYEECGIYETKAGATNTKTESTTKVIGITVNTKGCHYKFNAETTEGNTTGGKHANVNIENAGGECTHIKVEVLSVACIEVPVQTVTHAVHYNEVLENKIKSIEIVATAHEIESTTTNNNVVCPTETGGTIVHKKEGAKPGGSYVGSVTVTGWEDAAHTKQVGIWVE